jgi:signal peptidase I
VFFFDFTITEGNSMDPAIKHGTILLINKLAYGWRPPGLGRYLFRWALPKKGDVVIFYTLQGDLAVKRCSQVFAHSFFALGDNGPRSYDSRHYGPVPLDNIIGKAVGVR